MPDDDDRLPWEPPGSELVPGDRVRVRLSGECEYGAHEDANYIRDRTGRAGTVDAVFPGMSRHHVYLVLQDIDIYAFFSRSELERLAEPRGAGEQEETALVRGGLGQGVKDLVLWTNVVRREYHHVVLGVLGVDFRSIATAGNSCGARASLLKKARAKAWLKQQPERFPEVGLREVVDFILR